MRRVGVIAAVLVALFCMVGMDLRRLPRAGSQEKTQQSGEVERSVVAAPAVERRTSGSVATTTPPPPVAPRVAADRSPYAGQLVPVLSEHWSEGKFSHFSAGEQDDLAARCELRWRLPPFGAGAPSLGDDYDEVLRAEREKYTAQLRALYAELTGDDGARLDWRALSDAVRQAPDTDPVEARRHVAKGDADGSVYERYLRLQVTAGDAFEHALAEKVGAARAAELRDAGGPRFTMTGCDPKTALFRSER